MIEKIRYRFSVVRATNRFAKHCAHVDTLKSGKGGGDGWLGNVATRQAEMIKARTHASIDMMSINKTVFVGGTAGTSDDIMHAFRQQR